MTLGKMLIGMGLDIDALDRDVNTATKKLMNAGSGMRRIGRSLSIGLTLPLLAVGGASVSMSRDFQTAMAEVSTSLEDVSGLPVLTQQVKDLSREFGGAPITNAKALYDIVSAGITDTAEATNLLTAANKLAVGGVTDVAVAADGLTNIINAFGKEAGTVTEISDAMFVSMRDGKSTIADLSSNIGKVAPIAAEAGLSLDSILAATAVLTKGGITTSQAMIGLKNVINSVVKPTSEASAAAQAMGLDFSTAALTSKGLAGFLQDVAEKTHGNVDQMALLFGGLKGLLPVLTLTGKGAGDFATILGNMERKAGATDSAVDKMSATAGVKLNKALASLKVSGIELGDKILPKVAELAEKVTQLSDNFLEMSDSSQTMVLAIGGVLLVLGPMLTLIGNIIKGLAFLKIALLASTGFIKGWGNAFMLAYLDTFEVVGIIAKLRIALNTLFLTSPAGIFLLAAAAAYALWKAVKAVYDNGRVLSYFFVHELGPGIMDTLDHLGPTFHALAETIRAVGKAAEWMWKKLKGGDDIVLDPTVKLPKQLTGGMGLTDNLPTGGRKGDLFGLSGLGAVVPQVQKVADQVNNIVATVPPANTPGVVGDIVRRINVSFNKLDASQWDAIVDRYHDGVTQLAALNVDLMFETDADAAKDLQKQIAALGKELKILKPIVDDIAMSKAWESMANSRIDTSRLKMDKIGGPEPFKNTKQDITLSGGTVITRELDDAMQQLANSIQPVPEAARPLPGLFDRLNFSMLRFHSAFDPLIDNVKTVASRILASVKDPESGAVGIASTAIDVVGSGLSAAMGSIMQAIGPFAFLMSFVNGVMKSLGPVIEKLLAPVGLLGELVGAILIPIINALTPPLRFLAKVATYVVSALGWLIRAIGKAVNWLLPGNPANGLVKFGQNMMDQADATRAAIDATADMATTVAEASKQFDSLNIPEWFKVSRAEFNATRTGSMIPASYGYKPQAGAQVIDASVHFGEGSIVIQGANKTGAQLHEEVLEAARKKQQNRTGTTAGVRLFS